MADPRGLAIDPSGLYVAMSINNNSLDQDIDIKKRWTMKQIQDQSTSRTRVVFYELGTGLLATEISCLFDISAFSFSPNGKFFVVGSKTGTVSIWAIGETLSNNIQKILTAMEVKPDFWSAYPLYVKNSYTQDEPHTRNEYDNPQKRNNLYAGQNQFDPDQKTSRSYYDVQNKRDYSAPRHAQTFADAAKYD